MDVISRPLKTVEARDYLVEVLEHVAMIDADIVNRLERGSLSALAPATVPEERLYDFIHGGLLRRADATPSITDIIEPVENSALYLARDLLRFRGLDCMIHDPLRKIDEVDGQDGEPLLLDGALFYNSRNCLDSLNSCERAILRNTVSWHFLLLIGAFSVETQYTFQHFIQSARCIVFGAYDGESYLIWFPK